MQHYPSQGPYPPPPPPVAHKVWILDCSSCGLFLTNRAMKVRPLVEPVHSFPNLIAPGRLAAPAERLPLLLGRVPG
ncbi:hypothetical protein H1R20_g8791, partial [Candolleomyces eurysporus]